MGRGTEIRHRYQVLILGGGLAGLAAACELAERGRGLEPLLIERRPYLGGRASSFFHRGLGEEVDLGQHVFMRCCTAYIDFLRRIGAWEPELVGLQGRLSVEVHSREGKRGLIEGSVLPGPLYLLPSLLRYPFLTPGERLRLLRAGLAALASRAAADRDPGLARAKTGGAGSEATFREWLIARRQTPRTIQRFWDFLILPTLNASVGEVSAATGLMVLQEAFLKGHGADIGYARVGLSQLAVRAKRYIEERGGRVLLGKGVKSLLIEDGRVKTVELTDGQLLDGELFISALPPEGLLRALPASWRAHPFFARAGRLEWNPIVNLYLWFDRPVMEEELDFIAFLDSPVQWVFNRSKLLAQAQPGPGQQLCLSLSGAQQLIGLPPEGVLRRLLPELKELFPEARRAKLKGYLVVKQPRATISLAPGMERYRLPHRTPLENLLLAGDWTAVGWPSTMEGAVRSGLESAREALNKLAVGSGSESGSSSSAREPAASGSGSHLLPSLPGGRNR